jgi:hypothetical protein
MRKVFSSLRETFEIFDAGEGVSGGQVLEFSDRYAAETFLRRFVRDPVATTVFRDMLPRGLAGSGLHRLSDQQVVEQLALSLAAGQVLVAAVPRPEAYWRAIEGERREEVVEAPPAAATRREEPRAERSWIKFRVVDDESGEPVAGVSLQVKLPTGEIRSCTTDSAGLAEVDDLPWGSCSIERVDSEEALEVIGVS